MEKIAMKSNTDHSDSGISKMLILIDAYFVILLQCNKMTTQRDNASQYLSALGNLIYYLQNEITAWECKTVKHLIKF